MVAGREVMHGLSNMNFYSPRPTWLQPFLSIQTAFQISLTVGSASAKTTIYGLIEFPIHYHGFCTALLITKEIHSQRMKCGSGLLLMEFTLTTMFIVALKQLI